VRLQRLEKNRLGQGRGEKADGVFSTGQQKKQKKKGHGGMLPKLKKKRSLKEETPWGGSLVLSNEKGGARTKKGFL